MMVSMVGLCPIVPTERLSVVALAAFIRTIGSVIDVLTS